MNYRSLRGALQQLSSTATASFNSTPATADAYDAQDNVWTVRVVAVYAFPAGVSVPQAAAAQIQTAADLKAFLAESVQNGSLQRALRAAADDVDAAAQLSSGDPRSDLTSAVVCADDGKGQCSARPASPATEEGDDATGGGLLGCDLPASPLWDTLYG